MYNQLGLESRVYQVQESYEVPMSFYNIQENVDFRLFEDILIITDVYIEVSSTLIDVLLRWLKLWFIIGNISYPCIAFKIKNLSTVYYK